MSASIRTAGAGTVGWRERLLRMGRRNAWSLGLVAFLVFFAQDWINKVIG